MGVWTEESQQAAQAAESGHSSTADQNDGVEVVNAASLGLVTTVALNGAGRGRGVAFASDGSAWVSDPRNSKTHKIIVTTAPGANGTNGAPGS